MSGEEAPNGGARPVKPQQSTHDESEYAVAEVVAESLPPDRGAPASEQSRPATLGSASPLLPTLGQRVREQPPVRWREIVALLLLVALCDVTMYRGQGFAGYALLFTGAPALLLAGCFRPRGRLSLWIVGIMLLVLSAKMLWCGSELLVSSGFVLLVAFAMSLSGLCPYVLETAVFASQTILAGYEGFIHYGRSCNKLGPTITRGSWLNTVLPLVTLVLFSVLFVLANPKLLTWFGETADMLVTTLRAWMIEFAPGPMEVCFWLAVLWIGVGLLRPVISRALFEERSRGVPSAEHSDVAPNGGVAVSGTDEPVKAFLYPAFRNTLVTVILLFAVYLVFEFATLWFREFEEGFYYSGYAHEGAAWLTVALALSTGILSLVFRGRILQDPRLPKLRRLGWLWSMENMLLAVAVYHRLYIYIGFNGMTRMRTVGVFGMSAVVVGFILVLWKIACNRDFVWLMRRHLWTLAVTIYLFALTPVDTLVVSYNVRRILSGDPAPSVQISVHPISSEGVLLLEPLVHCRNEKIREGVRAMLAQRHEEAETLARQRREQGWTAFQIADHVVLNGLREAKSSWARYADKRRRAAALEAFHEYAYQWY